MYQKITKNKIKTSVIIALIGLLPVLNSCDKNPSTPALSPKEQALKDAADEMHKAVATGMGTAPNANNMKKMLLNAATARDSVNILIQLEKDLIAEDATFAQFFPDFVAALGFAKEYMNILDNKDLAIVPLKLNPFYMKSKAEKTA